MVIDTKLATGIVGCLGHSWSENVFSDIIVVIDGQKFHCHRFHLSACSELFRVLLGSNASFNYLTIKGIKPDIFDIILNSIYKGENRITTENMVDLWYAVHQLEIRFLLDEIENFIMLNISKDNYLQIFDVARDLKSNHVLTAVCQTMIENWEEFRQDQRFLTLSFEELQNIIQNLNTLSPDDLVESILIWTNYEPSSSITTRTHNVPISTQMEDEKKCVEITLKNLADLHISGGITHDELTTRINRKELCGKLLKNVNLELVSLNGLKKLLCDDVVMDCKEARDLVRQALASSLESLGAANLGTVKESTQSKQPKVPEVAKTLPTTLFFDDSNKLIAYNFKSCKFYSVEIDVSNFYRTHNITDFFVNAKYLFVKFTYTYTQTTGRAPIKTYIFRIDDDRVGHNIDYYEPGENDLTTACGVFFYRFIDNENTVDILRCTCKCRGNREDWHKVGNFVTRGDISSVFSFKDIILVVVSVDFQTTQFFYFDTTSRITRLISEKKVKAKALSAFYVDNTMYFLHGNGELFEVVRGTSVTLVLREQLKDFKLKVFGVVSHSGSIFIFCDLQKVSPSQHLPDICFLGDIRYIHVFNVKNKCLYMDVPQSWLRFEI